MFWQFWIGEMRDSVPRGLLDWLNGVPPSWELAFKNDGTRSATTHRRRLEIVFERSIERSTVDIVRSLGAVPKNSIIDVQLPKEMALLRRHEIPIAARRQINKILSLDLKRSTPLDPVDVLWRHAITGQSDAVLLVDQFIVKRADLALLEARITRAGCVMGDIRLGDKGEVPSISFAGARSARKAALGIWPRVNLCIAGFLVLLTVGSIWLPHADRQRALEVLRAETNHLRAETVAARTALSRRTAERDAERTLATYLNSRQVPSELLRELTLRIPDNAWVSDLEISGSTLRFNGLIDGSAADLSISLADSKVFTNPRLTGPVSSAPGSGQERFGISVDLEGTAR